METKPLALKIETVRVADLIADPRNIRKHDARNLAAIKTSLETFGQQIPIVIDGAGLVVAGNGGLESARALGWETIEAVRTELTGAAARAFAIADNRTAELAQWDDLQLSAFMSELEQGAPDLLDALGFDDKERGAFMDLAAEVAAGSTVETEPERLPPRVSKGEVWALGNHRLYCGDSYNAQACNDFISSTKINFCLTDPPYGINLNTNYSIFSKGMKFKALRRNGKINRPIKSIVHKPVINDTAPFDFGAMAWIECQEQIWFGANYYACSLPAGGCWICWDKRETENIDQMLGACFEIAWSKTKHKQMMYRHNHNHAKEGGKLERVRFHPTQKPVALWIAILADYCERGAVVLDPFVGSGTTIIACERTARTCYAIECDPQYCDHILARWELEAGATATLERVIECKPS